ncbi:MAG: LLM class flavin-dependent oxidoreductase [Pseudomonadota bacterium]|nr:LLM class flavin-dependent oxidoreductase [Pseudomonadota bacterium]
MDIDIILESTVSPSEFSEVAVAAEKLGIRAIWSSNYHQNYDAFLTLAPAAQNTSKILLGALAISPWEMHPLKMSNALMTLNEISNGRAIVAISGGGGVLGSMGWKTNKNAEIWPIRNKKTGQRYPEKKVRGVRECIEVLQMSRSGEMNYSYDGEIFQITRPFKMDWAKSETGPYIYGCCSGPMMIRMGSKMADGIQVSDFTTEMMPEAMKNVSAGLKIRETAAKDFRIGNFWAWHIKEDKENSMYEARRELIWRGAIVAQYPDEIKPHVEDDDDVALVINNRDSFFKAFWSRTGVIDNVPDELVNKLISGMTSAGDLNSLDEEIVRIKKFASSGLTELSLRLFDDPMDGLKIIGKHLLPKLH